MLVFSRVSDSYIHSVFPNAGNWQVPFLICVLFTGSHCERHYQDHHRDRNGVRGITISLLKFLTL